VEIRRLGSVIYARYMDFDLLSFETGGFRVTATAGDTHRSAYFWLPRIVTAGPAAPTGGQDLPEGSSLWVATVLFLYPRDFPASWEDDGGHRVLVGPTSLCIPALEAVQTDLIRAKVLVEAAARYELSLRKLI